MMKLLSLLFLLPAASMAFSPLQTTTKSSTTQLSAVSRRDVLVTTVAAAFTATSPAVASQQGVGTDRDFAKDNEYIPAQQRRDKLDLNSAFVGDYKAFPGMFPTAAGKIASNGPYDNVGDIYKIPGLTKNDINLFKKYDKYFTALPASPRTFNERINARVST